MVAGIILLVNPITRRERADAHRGLHLRVLRLLDRQGHGHDLRRLRAEPVARGERVSSPTLMEGMISLRRLRLGLFRVDHPFQDRGVGQGRSASIKGLAPFYI